MASFWVAVVSLFSKLRIPIQKAINSMRPQDSTHKEGADSQDKGSHSVPPKSDSVPARTDKKKSDKKCRMFLEWGTFALEILGLAGLAIYASLTYKMWREMQEQTRIQRQVFTDTQRPRLGIDGRPIITGPIEISGENGHRTAKIQTVMYVKNFGSQPAMHLGFDARIFVPGNLKTIDDYTNLLNMEAEVACKMADLSTVNKKGPYVFPNNTYFELENNSIQEGNKDGFTWQFKVVGCISYWDDISKTIHHTRFCFKSAGNSPTGGIDKITPEEVLYACEENQTTD
jgi:hypothetical protein